MVVSTLKIYLHDGTADFRIQLAGEMTRGDLKELRGCWRTAKSSVAHLPLVLDVTKLNVVDEAGLGWFALMLSEGARVMDGSELTDFLPKRLTDSGRQTSGSSPKTSNRRWRSIVSHVQRSFAAKPVQVK